MQKKILDILIYAHDGRGLGHISRSIGIAAAIRRLYPELRIIFVTGSAKTQSLIGTIPLDWIKLPAYQSKIENGIGRNRKGYTNCSNSTIVATRTELLEQIFQTFRPRVVLVDHVAGGKREELLPAMEKMQETTFVLGLRGLLGNVDALWTDTTIETIKRYYTSVFWYGDREVLGDSTPLKIREKLGVEPLETGYVSRLREIMQQGEEQAADGTPKSIAGVAAITWKSEEAEKMVVSLAAALDKLGDSFGEFHIYSPFGHSSFESLPHCKTFNLGPDYLNSLMQAKTAVIYGGYNSLTDVLALGKPAIIVQRRLDDEEQRLHAEKLMSLYPDHFQTVSEEKASESILSSSLSRLLQYDKPPTTRIKLDGATQAAEALVKLL